MSIGITLAERGILPDGLVRIGIRRLLRDRLRDEGGLDDELARQRVAHFAADLEHSPIAVEQDAANRQHYEVPAAFYKLVLGAQLKYSSCWFEPGVDDLDVAEEAMLARTAERAGLSDGQEILEIGCGWGSLTLWMARRFPRSRIRAVSNSRSQRDHIMGRAEAEGLANLVVDTADIAEYQPAGRYDRIVSVECFEHCRNYRELFARLASWLRPDGRVFVHVFCHRSIAYPFTDDGDDDWMARHFFSGGTMPSFDLFERFDRDLVIEERWAVDGQHYARTSEAWLARLDHHREEVVELFTRDLGRSEARLQYRRWRLFFLACAELFGYRGGSEWLVGHYRFAARGGEQACA